MPQTEVVVGYDNRPLASAEPAQKTPDLDLIQDRLEALPIIPVIGSKVQPGTTKPSSLPNGDSVEPARQICVGRRGMAKALFERGVDGVER
jgi:hypothetical protein